MKTLFRQVGDPGYLKVAILQELVKLQEFKLEEGDNLVLVLEDGTKVLSANKICNLLCVREGVKDFIGQTSNSFDWLEWEAKELESSIRDTLSSSNTLTNEILVCLKHLESHLTTCGSHYLAKEKLTLADVVVWASLYVLLSPEANTSQTIMTGHPQINHWFTSLAASAHFTTAVGKASDDMGYRAYYDFCCSSTLASVLQAGTGTPNDDVVSSVVDKIPVMELEAAKESWTNGHQKAPRRIKREHPILPAPGERNILITSALPYVNNVPHLGNIIGCVLSGDVFARYCRLRNYCTLYICGTDEYGTATETKAIEEGITPQEICQKYFTVHASIYDWFNIQFDYFGRTSTEEQTKIAQDIFWRCHDRGFIIKDTVDQLYCEQCNMFLADRFVEGICPLCSYEDARGDQCDKCGKLINATELKSPRCKLCSNQPKIKTSNHLFLDLSKLEPSVKTWFQQSSGEGLWTANAVQITSSWLRDGLKPRCISRDLKWGTPVPLEGYKDKVFYVWFDAPIGYLSITACYTKEWERWWKNPEQVQLYQFMAKDNVPFHTVVFPCSLIGTKDNYTLLNHISSTEYLNYEDGKFSKSRGVGVFGNNAMDTGIPADVFRFYLLYVRPETQDSSFSWTDFVLKNNTELLNNLGNFINRVLTFIKNNFDSTVQEVTITDKDVEFLARVNREISKYLACMEKVKIRDGLRHVLAISRLGNAYIQANKPWMLMKGTPEERARAGSVVGVATNVVCILSVMVEPYMPNISKQIQEQLKAPEDCNVLTEALTQFIPTGHKLGKPMPLFEKIDGATAQKLKERFAGKQETGPADKAGGKQQAASVQKSKPKKDTSK